MEKCHKAALTTANKIAQSSHPTLRTIRARANSLRPTATVAITAVETAAPIRLPPSFWSPYGEGLNGVAIVCGRKRREEQSLQHLYCAVGGFAKNHESRLRLKRTFSNDDSHSLCNILRPSRQRART